MYALLVPSAQRFISSLEEKVNVEERTISEVTGFANPWRTGSPAWIVRVDDFSCGAVRGFMVAIIRRAAFRRNHQFGCNT